MKCKTWFCIAREDEGPKQPDKPGRDTAAPAEKKKEVVKKTVKISSKVSLAGGVRARLMLSKH